MIGFDRLLKLYFSTQNAIEYSLVLLYYRLFRHSCTFRISCYCMIAFILALVHIDFSYEHCSTACRLCLSRTKLTHIEEARTRTGTGRDWGEGVIFVYSTIEQDHRGGEGNGKVFNKTAPGENGRLLIVLKRKWRLRV